MKGFIMILFGEFDDLLEQVFYMVGDINEVMVKVEKFKVEVQ